MVRRRTLLDDEDDDLVETGCHVDPRVEEAWQTYFQSRAGTPECVQALATYKRLLLGLPDDQERHPVPRFDVSVPLPHYMNRHRLVYLDGLRRPWRLTVVADVNNPKYGYYAKESEARRAAKRLGIVV